MMKTKITLLMILIVIGLYSSSWAVRQPQGDTAPVDQRDQSLNCDAIVPIEIGEIVYGDNSGLPNGANLYSCMYWDMWGGETIYELTVSEAALYTVTLYGPGSDLGILMLADCSRMSTCWGYSDENTSGTEWFSAHLTPGVYYIVVDGFFHEDGCPYELLVSASEPDLGVAEYRLGTDRCDEESLVCLEPTTEPRLIETSTDTMLGFTEDYEIGYTSCLVHGHAYSPDAVFAVALNDGDELYVRVWTDYMTAYVTDDCDLTQCLAGTDTLIDDPPRAFTYTHSGDYQLIYLVVAGAAGSVLPVCHFEYTHNGDCALAVANEEASWGAVKTLYR
jgi:hypothetical protein